MKTDLRGFTSTETYREHYDGCPAFVEMTGAGFTRPLYGGPVPSYEISLSFFKSGQGDYLTLISNQREIGKAVIKNYMEDKGVLLDLYKRWLANFQEMLKRFDRSFSEDLSTLSDEELVTWSNNLSHYYAEEVCMPGFIDGYMFYADKHLDEILREFCAEHSIQEYSTIYSALAAPSEPSFINEEETELRKVAGMNEPERSIALQNHVRTYTWIKSSYSGYRPYTVEMALQEMEALQKAKPIDEEHFMQNVRTKKELITKYGFTDEIRAIAALTELLIKWQDQRKEYTLTFVALKQKVLDEVSRRTGIAANLLAYSQTSEIPDLLSKTVDSSALIERQKGCLCVYQNGTTVEIVAGGEAQIFLDGVSKIDIGDVKEVSGTVASLGKVTGKVKVIMTAEDIYRVEVGDILVAPMTRPEHLAGMKKAAAIVTDDGGITCHAAIVSRELKKPCIIGTKIATKVFKDGDIVEVDGQSGVVRKLEQ